MNIKIIYDNQAEDGFTSGWGFSALVDGHTLFDTGEAEGSLALNLKAFDVDISAIRTVVLSHEHWDHCGGISILKRMNGPRVFVPASFSRKIKKELSELNQDGSIVEVDSAMQLGGGLFVTQPLGFKPREISLVGKTEKGIVVITGCAHPGLQRIIAAAEEWGSVRAVIGGFHGFGKISALAGVDLIVPTHCTRKTEEILQAHEGRARRCSAGSEINYP